MIRVGKKYSIEEVFEKIPKHIKNGEEIGITKIREIFDGDEIKVTSQRLQTFYIKGIKCCECGIEGQFFIKEKGSEKEKRYHLNLYGLDENGKEVLFTKDHILPISKGGKSNIENYQTMCQKCNLSKGNQLK